MAVNKDVTTLAASRISAALTLLEIANKCPVHRTLHSEVWIPTHLG